MKDKSPTNAVVPAKPAPGLMKFELSLVSYSHGPQWSFQFIWPAKSRTRSPLWILHTPRLANPAARLRRRGPNQYSLRLRILDPTQPVSLQIQHPGHAGHPARDPHPTIIFIHHQPGRFFARIQQPNRLNHP